VKKISNCEFNFPIKFTPPDVARETERGLKPATTCMPARYLELVVAGFSPRSGLKFAIRNHLIASAASSPVVIAASTNGPIK